MNKKTLKEKKDKIAQLYLQKQDKLNTLKKKYDELVEQGEVVIKTSEKPSN